METVVKGPEMACIEKGRNGIDVGDVPWATRYEEKRTVNELKRGSPSLQVTDRKMARD